jgi:hypothetical protein
MTGLNWLTLALVEGFLMGVAKIGHGLVGSVSITLGHVMFATGVVGIVVASIGFFFGCLQKHKIWVTGWNKWGSMLFGLGCILATICAFAAFRNGARADMGANTFISGPLGILVLCVLGGIRYKEMPSVDKIGAALLALIGAYMVTKPNARLLSGDIPVWVWWSLGTCVFASGTRFVAKETAVQGIKAGLPKTPPWIKIFWGGLVMSLALPLGILMRPAVVHDAATTLLVPFAIFVALPTLGWWFCRFSAYQNGAPLGMKEVSLSGAYLAVGAIAGMLFFQDSMSPLKIAGLAMFAPAVLLEQGVLTKQILRVTEYAMINYQAARNGLREAAVRMHML